MTGLVIGRPAVEAWAGTWSFEWAVVAADGDVDVVEGRTTYRDPQAEYSNIWLIRFDATAQCREFTEWWVDRALGDPGQPG